MRLPTGHRIDRYRVISFLGAGAMGEVYQATDTRLERSVALKVLASGLLARGSDAEASSSARRLLREAKAVAALEHPNIVAVFDVGEVEGPEASGPVTFLAMELVRGAPLRTYVGREPPALEKKLGWLIDVARALGAAHRAGLVHRDVKPDNVMIREDGVVKVLDFGIAKRATLPVDPNAPTGTPDTGTQAGSIVGTPYYMAPEQMRGQEVDGRADQFAWGVMAYELLCGARPWKEGDAVQLIAEVLTHVPEPLYLRVPSIPYYVARVVMRALEKAPGDRFASMEDLVAALGQKSLDPVPTKPDLLLSDPHAAALLGAQAPEMGTGGSLASTRVLATQPRPATRKRAWWLVATALAAVAGALGVAGITHRAGGSANVPAASVSASAGPASSSHSDEASFPDYGSVMSKVPLATEAYRAGVSLLRDAAVDGAVRELDRALALDPSFAAAHLRRAVAMKMPPSDSDRQHLQDATRMRASLGEHDQRLIEALAPIASAPGDLAETGKRLGGLVQRFPSDADLVLQFCRVQAALGDYAGAAATCSRANELDPLAAAPLSEHARALIHADDASGGLASFEACLQVSPLATDCLFFLSQFHAVAGECQAALTMARRYVSADRDNSDAYELLAEMLMGNEAPVESVRTALSDRWDRTPAPLAKVTTARDRSLLAIATGDFTGANAQLRAWEDAVAGSRDEDDHFDLTVARIDLALEQERKGDVRALASAYLAHRPAWTLSESNDGSMFCTGALYRTGALSRGDFVARRSAWLEARAARPRGSDYGATPVLDWIAAFAEPATSADDAREALDALPRYLPLPDPLMRVPEFQEPIGKVYRLAGRDAEAIPFLRVAARSCIGLQSTVVPTWASLELGDALDASGDHAGACDAYRAVLERWGATSTSSSARLAAEKMRAGDCPK